MEQLSVQFAKGDRHARRDVFWIIEKFGPEFLTTRTAPDQTLPADLQAILDAYVERRTQGNNASAPCYAACRERGQSRARRLCPSIRLCQTRRSRSSTGRRRAHSIRCVVSARQMASPAKADTARADRAVCESLLPSRLSGTSRHTPRPSRWPHRALHGRCRSGRQR